jgi:hypothetical protein
MVHDLLVRGFDDKIHSQLGELAKEKGVSINSIVKDAVDKWLQQRQSDIPKKHYLLIYSDDDAILGLLKSMDRLAKEGDLFRCYCSPPSTEYTRLLSKLKWFDGTIMPYYYGTKKNIKQNQSQQIQIQNQKDSINYCNKVMENIVEAANNANNKQLCCIDFLINDIAKSSIHEALILEKIYDDNRIPGLMYCVYKTETLLCSEIRDLVELFEGHDQVFILKDDDVYKLHLTKENVHKLFLN